MKLVSAVMPTRGRRELARCALNSFLAQTYPRKELVILDDAEEPSFDGVDHPEVRYSRVPGHEWIPVKRNLVNGLTHGEIIMHWDSDDWSAPERMADQVNRLQVSGKVMTGYHSMLFVTETGAIYKFLGFAGDCSIGSSLCYWKSFWQQFPFRENKRLASDVVFAKEAISIRQMESVDADEFMVARIHQGNSSGKDLRQSNAPFGCFKHMPEAALPALFPIGAPA